MVRLLHFGAQERAGAEELVLWNALHYVGEGEVELLYGEEGGIAERDERAAAGDEIAQRLRAGFADATGVLAGDGTGRHAVHDLASVHFGEDDGIEVVVQMAVLQVGVAHDGEGELVLFEEPARPARVDVASPWFVKRDPGLLHG